MENSIFRKGLVCGIIVLFLGMSIAPLASSQSIETRASTSSSVHGSNVIKTAGSEDVSWTVNGTHGDNGWYVSPITLACTYDHDAIAEVNYRYSGTDWVLYTEPFTISKQGIIEFEWYSVDCNGTVSRPQGPFRYRLDWTPPVVNVHVEKRFMKLIITVTIYDEYSGINRVEFYLNGALQFVDTDPPFEWTLSPIPHVNLTMTVVAYDNAGNKGSANITTGCSQSQQSNQQSSQLPNQQQINQLLQNLIVRQQTTSK